MARYYDAALADAGMTINQFALLRNIARVGTVALSRLAEVMVMDRTSLYRALAPLDRAEWIAFDSGGGRAKTVRLTDAGETAMQAATPVWQAAQTRLGDALGTVQWPEMIALLGTLSSAAQEVSHDR